MDFEKARFNMIEQQIRPWNVLNQRVLDLLKVVKRETFVAPGLEKLAFTDCDLPIRVDGQDSGQFMLSPKMEARILQELDVFTGARVLEIGTGTGYMAALLAQTAGQVTTVEINPALVTLAQANFRKNNITRVKLVEGCGFGLAAGLGEFDLIVLAGSCPVLPVQLASNLAASGRMISIVGKAPVMQVQLSKRTSEGRLVSTPLFETVAPALQNAPAGCEFVF